MQAKFIKNFLSNRNNIIDGFGRCSLGYFTVSAGEDSRAVRNEEWYGEVSFRPMFREMTIMVHDNGASFWLVDSGLQYRTDSSPLIVLRATSREDAVRRAIQSLGLDPEIVPQNWWRQKTKSPNYSSGFWFFISFDRSAIASGDAVIWAACLFCSCICS